MFREVFEISLVVGIMLAYLHKTKNGKHAPWVYAGAALADHFEFFLGCR
jgi:high-affinity Fe2+/Pb2+ permease